MIYSLCDDWCLVKERNIILFRYNDFKSYLEETRMDEDAYLYYPRRNNNKCFECPDGYIVDNCYVLSYFIDYF